MENPNTNCFTYCPNCGASTLVPRSIKSFGCESCGFGFYLNCASAAMALIFDMEKRLLATVRKNDPARGTLDLPGGFIEPGETLEQGLAREVKEELNLDIVHLSYLCSFPNTYVYDGVVYQVTDAAFVCGVRSLEGITAMNDIEGFEFLDLNGVDLSRFGLDSPKKVIQFYLHRHPCR